MLAAESMISTTPTRRAPQGGRGPLWSGSAAAGRRWLPLAAALLVLVAAERVLPALHFALVSHAICAEHGELTHVAHEAPPAKSANSASARTTSVTARAPAWTAASRGSPHGHEHCEGLACRETDGGVIGRAAGETRSADARRLETSGGQRSARVGIALLAYAPKLAPPG